MWRKLLELERFAAMAVFVAGVVMWAKAPQWRGADGRQAFSVQTIQKQRFTAMRVRCPSWLRAWQPGEV
jgi:hypothetical protein